MGDGSLEISFTVKEMFQDIREQLSLISRKLDEKADNARLVVLQERVTTLESEMIKRTVASETTETIKRQVRTLRLALGGLILAGGGILVDLIVRLGS